MVNIEGFLKCLEILDSLIASNHTDLLHKLELEEMAAEIRLRVSASGRQERVKLYLEQQKSKVV